MKLDGIIAGYGKNVIVESVSADIQKGEIISLIGPNGGGKSTLLRTISGHIRALFGAVYIGKEDIRNISLKELAKKLSIVTTERIKPELMSSYDVVLSGRLPYAQGFGTFAKADYDKADKAAKLMKITDFMGKPFEVLSDGQKQRTLIARAICQEPEYLIMDEPTSYLDIRYQMELMEVLKKLSKEGVTIVMSMHEPALALEISHRVMLVYSDGSVLIHSPEQVLLNGRLKDLYHLDDKMYAKVEKQLQKSICIENEESDKKAGSIRHSSFFTNRECEYYPCHELADEKFSCMFCYCPLYDMEDCGGTYTYTEKGAKNCKNCTFPHDRDNYGKVIKKLKEKMYGNRQFE